MFDVAIDVLNGCNVEVINCTIFQVPKMPKFDVVYSHLVAHIIDDVDEFFISIAKHLDCGAHFIFSIPHPCFYNDYKQFLGS